MPNRPLKMNKLRTIIRLYTDRVGLRAIAEMARTSRNTVKKYVNKWNTLSLTYKEFLSKSDAELYALFCIEETPVESNPRIDALEAFLPSASKEMGRKGMTSHKQSRSPFGRLQSDAVPCRLASLRTHQQPVDAYGA